MANSYNVSPRSVVAATTPATLLSLAFGSPAQNDQIVRDAVAALEACKLEGGALCLLNGPASLPVACALAHGVGHLFGAVGCFDPKMGGYVVCISHTPEFPLGTVIPAADVQG